MDGFEVARRVREKHAAARIIFVTARDSPEDRARGWASGGDEYITKPFSLEALVRCVRDVLAAPRERKHAQEISSGRHGCVEVRGRAWAMRRRKHRSPHSTMPLNRKKRILAALTAFVLCVPLAPPVRALPSGTTEKPPPLIMALLPRTARLERRRLVRPWRRRRWMPSPWSPTLSRRPRTRASQVPRRVPAGDTHPRGPPSGPSRRVAGRLRAASSRVADVPRSRSWPGERPGIRAVAGPEVRW